MRAHITLRALLAVALIDVSALNAQQPPLVDARAVWTAADNPSAILSRSALFAVDAAGNIYYPEPDESTVFVFDSLGRYQRSIGRKGGGPGEFQGICCAAIDPKGRLWVRDMGGARYNVFPLNAAPPTRAAFQVKMAHTDPNLWVSLRFNRQGWLYDRASRTEPGSTSGRGYVRLLVDTVGVVRATRAIATPPGVSAPFTVTSSAKGESTTRFFYQPYGASALHADGPLGDMAIANSKTYDITWTREDQSLRHRITRKIDGPALESAERKRVETELRAIATEAKVDVSALPFIVPERKPVLRSLQFDLEGRLWVERYVKLGTARESDVFDLRGKLLFTVVWPNARGLTFTGVARGNDVWVVTETADDVPRIVKLRLTPRK